MLSKKAALLLMMLFAADPTSAQTQVTGKVTAADGKPMLMANVFLAQPNDTKILRSVEADKDGNFNLAIDSAGVWILRFTGVYHQEYSIALYIVKTAMINIDVRLETYTYMEDFRGVEVNGSFNNWYILRAVSMKKQPDGTYVAEIETKEDSIAYRLMYVRSGDQVEGTQADRYAYNGSTGYNSLVAVKGGKARIVFDPEKLVRSKMPPKAAFLHTDPVISKFAMIYEELQQYRKTYTLAYQNFVRERKNRKEFTFDWSGPMSSVEEQIKGETSDILCEELYLNYITIAMLAKSSDTSVYRKSLDRISPASTVWSLNPHVIYYALGHSGLTDEQHEKYVQQVIDGNPVDRTKAALLLDEFMVSKLSEQKEKAHRYYDILVNQYGSSEEAKMIKERIAPQDSLRVGKAVPAFSFVSMDDSTKTITNESLKGKYYLISFWASKSEASLREMERLQETYEKYKGDNFTVLSLSLDESRQDVVKFRKRKWKMPWINAFLGRDINSKTVRDFNAFDIPLAFLVDPKGNLVAMGRKLLDEDLRIALEKYLGKQQK